MIDTPGLKAGPIAAIAEDKNVFRVFVVSLLAIACLAAQEATPRFEVATLKVNASGDFRQLVLIMPGVPGPAMTASTRDCAAINAARRGGPPPGPPDPTAPVQCGMMGFPGMIRSGGVPIDSIVQMLTNQSGRLVFDRTNLKGNWDFTLKFAEEIRGVPPPGVTPPPVDPDA